MRITLERTYTEDGPTLGRLTIPDPAGGKPLGVFATIERAWRDNVGSIGGATREDASCVPEGTYQLLPHVRPNDGDADREEEQVWALHAPQLDVFQYESQIPAELRARKRGRFLVLVHKGNTRHDVVGCIAPGQRHTRMRNRYNGRTEAAVSASVSAMRELRILLNRAGDEAHALEITEAAQPVWVD